MKLLPIGVGDMFVKDVKKGSTGFLIISGDQKTLVDCPGYVRALLKLACDKSDSDINLHEINDVIFTHLHDDHVNGLSEFGFYSYFIRKYRDFFVEHGVIEKNSIIKKPSLYSTKENLRDVWEKRLSAGMGKLLDENGDIKNMKLNDYFNPVELTFDKKNKIGNLEIEIKPTNHFISCFALKITYHGKTLGISSDTAYYPELIDWLSNSDMILHETNYGSTHTPYEKLADYVSRHPSIKNKIFLYHYPGDFDPKKSKIPFLEQGKIYEI